MAGGGAAYGRRPHRPRRPHPRWSADFLTPAPVPPPAGQQPDTFASELARVRATPPEAAGDAVAGESRLQINTYDNPPRELGGAQLVFTPVTADVGWVCWDIPHRYGVVYPCTGALADTGRAPHRRRRSAR